VRRDGFRIYRGERVESILDACYSSNKIAGYYDATLDTVAGFICHPDFEYGFYFKTDKYFRGWSISPLEQLGKITIVRLIALALRKRGAKAPYLAIPYGDNISVQCCNMKTFARSYGMDFVLDLYRKTCVEFDIEAQFPCF